MAKEIFQGRDFSFTMFLETEEENIVDITGHTFVRLKLPREDGTKLELFAPLTAPVNEIQKINFPSDSTSGSFTLDYGNGNNTSTIQFDDDNITVQTKINALRIFTQVVVSGSITQATGLTLTYSGNDGARDQPEPTITNNTLSDGSPVIPTVAELTKGVPESGLTVVSAQRGEILVKGSELDAAALNEGKNQTGVLDVKIGSLDLDIPPILNLITVFCDPLL